MKALAHFKEGHEKMETYVSSVCEALSNIELCSNMLIQQSDEYVVRKAMENWGLPCNVFQYSTSVRLALPNNFRQVMLTELVSSSECWGQGTNDQFVMGLISVLRSKNSCSPGALGDDQYHCTKDSQLRFSSIVPIGGQSFL